MNRRSFFGRCLAGVAGLCGLPALSKALGVQELCRDIKYPQWLANLKFIKECGKIKAVAEGKVITKAVFFPRKEDRSSYPNHNELLKTFEIRCGDLGLPGDIRMRAMPQRVTSVPLDGRLAIIEWECKYEEI